MPNRFLFSARFSSKVFYKISKLTFWFLLSLSMIRLSEFLSIVSLKIEDASGGEILDSFFMGIRFDLLVYGFLLIPIYLAIVFQVFTQKWTRPFLALHKLYFALTWMAIAGLTFIDFLYLNFTGRRMRYVNYQTFDLKVWNELLKEVSNIQILTISGVLMGLTVLLMTKTIKLQYGDWKDEYSPHSATRGEVAIRLLLPLILIALAARGTIEAHHLELAHSQVSQIQILNEMSLNAVWCFDK